MNQKSLLIKISYGFNKTNLTIFLFCCIISCKKEKKRIEKIYDNPSYAVGTINSYVKKPFKVIYNYSYTKSGSSYTGEDVSKGIGQLDKSLVGKSYLVVHDKSNVSDSDLNFNYPIKTQYSFDSLLIIFATSPPEPD